ncbi:MAG TPA: glycosyltransferase family 1 protein [Gemmatimonadaceae bacterium]|nr:glycosyltransferase family 1 protein [Gemmatimonadaceae bacterium]
MKVVLNLLYLLPGVVGGTETYAKSLIRAFARQDDDNEYSVFLNKESAELDVTPAANFTRVICPVKAMNRAARYSWEQGAMPLQLRRVKPDLVHSLGYVIPLAAKGPQVVTVHDVNYLGHKGWRTGIGRTAFRFFAERTVKRADRIIAVSNFSRDEIVRHMRVKPEKVTVVHSAGREATPRKTNGSAKSEVIRNLSRPYIMAFSALSAHKNIPRLINAFARIASIVPHDLVLVGHMPVKSAERAEMEAAGGHDRIHFTGYVPESDVSSLLQNASLFAFPSLYEGFGLPLLDAQNAGVPVVASSAGALPEIAGNSAVMFDPHSEEDMAKAMKRALLDPDLRTRLVEKGHENAQSFSWDRTARETLDVYKAVAS